jgi:hypothetical protein|tara:strand:+ start:640 stop:906 length:267 start_codon:yes stop_codon:yes gene_type:complete
MSKFGKKIKQKAALKGVGKGVTKAMKYGATKQLIGKGTAKVGSRLIPGLGLGLLGYDVGKLILSADKQAPQKQLKKRAKNKSRAGRKI